MNPDDKAKWFIVAGEALIKDFKLAETVLYVTYIPRTNSFRAMVEKGRDGKDGKKGFAIPPKMPLKEFERMFEEKLNELKRDSKKSGGLFSL